MIKKSFLLLFIVIYAVSFWFPLHGLFQVEAQEHSFEDNFETGKLDLWDEIIGEADISSYGDGHNSDWAFHSTGKRAGDSNTGGKIVKDLTATLGKTYKVSLWAKINPSTSCSGDCWGGFRPRLGNWGDNNEGTYWLTPDTRPVGEWFKEVFTFTATRDRGQLIIGPFAGKDWVWDVLVDDVRYFEDLPSNDNPIISSIEASPTSGTVPLEVSFSSDADDPDGAIKVYAWDFGDGGCETIPNPTHTFLSRGSYTVTLKVYDDDGATAEQSLTIEVNDDEAPMVNITSPTITETSNPSITVSGNASDNQGQVESLVWDNISTGQAGIIPIIPASSISWSTPAIDLKSGNSEILITASDNDGHTETDVIRVYRNISQPIISNIQIEETEVNVYEKFEAQFDLKTVADYWFFPYDENPPPGVDPKIGVTAEGVFTSPSGATIRHPAFSFTEIEQTGDWQNGHYAETPDHHWMVRLTPQEEGRWHFDIEVTDASGTTRVNGGDFTANPPTKKGFIRVSKNDTRYFEFSNGDPYWPMGPISDDYQQNQDYGMNHTRPWMGGRGAYSTNWARWISSAQEHGNEGYMSQLAFREHYPSSELSQEIFYPDGWWMWLGCLDDFPPQLEPNQNYQVAIRLKTENISGPASPGDYGLVIKPHGWRPNDTSWEDYLKSLPYDSMIPIVNGDHDWHTIIAQYTPPPGKKSHEIRYISLYLLNVTDGRVYIDEFSIKPILPDGSLGGELIRNPKADIHTYVEQRPAKYFDNQVEAGEQYGVFYKYVVQDKNDWIPNHLHPFGMFVPSGFAGGYYQPNGSKSRWLQHAWWRYLIARWGYSTAVHSWELNNEGPSHQAHHKAAQDFAQFMHQNDSHRHLATTSHWYNVWPPDFWGNTSGNYPEIDYADVHFYIRSSDAEYDDLAQWLYDESLRRFQDQVGKPIQIGETGIQGDDVDFFKTQTDPTWWHNFVWAGINHTGVSYPNYWYSDHLDQINYHTAIKAYTDFMKDIPLNSGYYQDAQAQVDNDHLRAWGQKDVTHGKAHLWIQNKRHTWRNVVDGVSISPVNGTVTIPDMRPGPYTVEWWDTYSGTVVKTETIDAGSGLVLTLPHALNADVAAKISWAGPDLSLSAKAVNLVTAQQGDVLTYTITLINAGASSSAVTLTDTIPSDTSYLAGSAHVSPTTGVLNDVAGIHWSGTLSETVVRVTFAVLVETPEPKVIVNKAMIDDGFTVLTKEATTIVNGYEVYLPLILRR